MALTIDHLKKDKPNFLAPTFSLYGLVISSVMQNNESFKSFKEKFGTSRPEVFFLKGVFKYFTEKQLCWSLFLTKFLFNFIKKGSSSGIFL